MDSPFHVLGIDPDANDDEIVSAYRQRVKEAHPDHGGSAEEFQTVRSAYAEIEAGYSGQKRGTGREGVPEPERADPTRIEFLNYEVLGDYRWSLDDDDLFEKASNAGLDPTDYGKILVRPSESILEAAENRGFAWPYACRGGACANCAVAVMEGALSMPVDHILPAEMMDRDIRLSCNAIPTTDEMKIVFNLKHLPDLEELRLPPHPCAKAHAEQ